MYGIQYLKEEYWNRGNKYKGAYILLFKVNVNMLELLIVPRKIKAFLAKKNSSFVYMYKFYLKIGILYNLTSTCCAFSTHCKCYLNVFISQLYFVYIYLHNMKGFYTFIFNVVIY